VLKTYYRLTKPGIIYGNTLTTIGGFLLAADGHIKIGLFIATIFGSALIIASACVFNNYIDRGLDKHMARTKKRALVTGTINPRVALIYGSVLGLFGVVLLYAYVNRLTLGIGLVAFVVYVALYGYAKRKSVHGTLVGTIAGSAPVVAGYCAVTDRFNGGAVILFLILVCWQMPHFYSIALNRFDDYSAAKLPVLPVKKGSAQTKTQMVVYIGLFILANISLSIFGYAGITYAVIMSLVGVYWLRLGIMGLAHHEKTWPKQMFLTSLVVILSLSVMLSVGKLLP
jgi:heme o synthase